MLANRARAALRAALGVRKKLGVSSFLDFQGAWYALFEALNGSEQFGVARSSGVGWKRVSKRFRNLVFV